jgi:hypothetical protein
MPWRGLSPGTQALVKASLVVNGQMWRWSLQIAMRLAFGLTLWITWAVALRESSG